MSFKYFKFNEFDSPDCPGSGELYISKKLIEKLDAVRNELGGPIRVNSGYRTPEHNKKVGGVADSPHLYGYAADLSVGNGRDRYRLITLLLKHGINRIGIGKNYIHIDIDPVKDKDVIWVYK